MIRMMHYVARSAKWLAMDLAALALTIVTGHKYCARWYGKIERRPSL